jgi:hypothetical protein
MVTLALGKNPIYFGVITNKPFDNLYRQAYFVMHTFLVCMWIIIILDGFLHGNIWSKGYETKYYTSADT